ncbi:MAG: aminomethyltransferase family protein, partial [Pseudomonadota bacterium]
GVTLSTATDETGILGLAGPKAREVLCACSPDDVSNEALPWLRCAHIRVAGVPVLALRLSFTGELAFELHAPNADLGHLWDALWTAGQPHGVAPFGSKALDSLRLEKFYRGGHELSNDAGHADVAQERFAKTDKEFVGRDAMLKRFPQKRIALLALEGEETDALVGEAVYKDGSVVGSVTSAAYGHTVGKSLAIAFLDEHVRSSDETVTLSILGQYIDARVHLDALWDPRNSRLRT